jgi:hypothetical protein
MKINNRDRDIVFKCFICGKFISYKDIENDKVKCDYTPDTEYSIEDIVYTHINCIKDKDYDTTTL